MDAGRLPRVLAALGQTGPPKPTAYPERVCAAAVELVGVTGAGLTLTGVGGLAAFWGSDRIAAEIESAQLTLGEGPGLDAYARSAPMLDPDLATASTRWPFLRRAALDLGIAALFAFPLQVGAISVGVLLLHRGTAGYLSDDQLADALVLADVATQDFLDFQATGALAWSEVEAGRRTRVHQATGMVSVQIKSSMADAMARLRGHAFANDATIYDVAEQVVSRRLRFE